MQTAVNLPHSEPTGAVANQARRHPALALAVSCQPPTLEQHEHTVPLFSSPEAAGRVHVSLVRKRPWCMSPRVSCLEAAGAENEVPIRPTEQPMMPAFGGEECDMLVLVYRLERKEVASLVEDLGEQIRVELARERGLVAEEIAAARKHDHVLASPDMPTSR